MNTTELKLGMIITLRPRERGERLVYGTEGQFPVSGGEQAEVIGIGMGTHLEVKVEGHGVVKLTIFDIT